jgi:hypothetical protein
MGHGQQRAATVRIEHRHFRVPSSTWRSLARSTARCAIRRVACTLPMLAATATRRAQWLSDRLAGAVQRDGLRALIDDQWGVDGQGNAVRLGEQIRALVTQQAELFAAIVAA